MINWNLFEQIVSNQLERNITANPQQHSAISAPINESLFIVAGPGSGKTTVIALRVLKLIFVDGISPNSIMVTTFTRKAASELRSRILGWGDQLRNYLINNLMGSTGYQLIITQLQRLDFNQLFTGTIDSIAEEVLRIHRSPGSQASVVIEDFISNALMIRFGLFSHGRHTNPNLKNYITMLRGSNFGLNVSEISNSLRTIKDRFYHDMIDVSAFRSGSSHPGCPVLCDAIDDYNRELQNRSLYDFALLEDKFLNQLRGGTLSNFLSTFKFLLVDEYQDTNLLQEQIYFEFAKAAIKNGGSITVVGDDDQALYRFRGATIDLFQNFPHRISSLGIKPKTIYLSKNYRSTKTIVNFLHKYVSIDSIYYSARIAKKPKITPSRSGHFINYPILGMFRDNVNVLARDLANFIHKIIHGGGYTITYKGKTYLIQTNSHGGSPADIALLCSSPREYNSNGKKRLPLLLREELSKLSLPIKIFNPRGQHLEKIPVIEILCGLLLECIDPQSQIQNSITTLPSQISATFNKWRDKGKNFMRSNPPPHSPTLSDFVGAWQNRNPLGRRLSGRQDVPLIDLVYKLVTWIPYMQSDIEGLVYLETVTRTISQSASFSTFGAEIIFIPGSRSPFSPLEQEAIKEAIWNIFVPLASGAIEVNEDLLETLPMDRINIMSIHQAKGLEFPLVIVDVGSDFKRDHHKQAYKRYPKLTRTGRVADIMSVNLEDELRPYSPLLGLPVRSPKDRAFDDLIRQFFVAFSRAQDVLLLVGLNSVRYNRIPNVATGWDRNGNWHWRRGLPNLIHI
ncbi:UvrD-helicase domain-containing protein [Thermodesulfovibrio yellowstonii]|uniref:UvrD-helicase domain-containing protein n=2 Tax=Thermodesulfovibrio yellowstonii TaxID=28262 RepID=UPI003C7A6B4A